MRRMHWILASVGLGALAAGSSLFAIRGASAQSTPASKSFEVHDCATDANQPYRFCRYKTDDGTVCFTYGAANAQGTSVALTCLPAKGAPASASGR